MIVNSKFLLAKLKKQIAPINYDDNKHLICPNCLKRTKLYKLGDGRRKCSHCLKKFSHKNKLESEKLKQFADIIVGFALNWTANHTSKYFSYRYSSVLWAYTIFRHLLVSESLGEDKLKGIIEADESYFGGINRKRNKKYRKPYVKRGRGTDKTPVFGIRERNGKVFIDILPNLSKKQINIIFKNKVERGSEVMTDEFKSYKGLIYRGYIHRFVEHGNEQYVKGSIHVNGMENFWSWAKEKMYKFHGVFRKNLIFYMKEIEWKFNNRNLTPEEIAFEIVKLLPSDFLKIWSKK